MRGLIMHYLLLFLLFISSGLSGSVKTPSDVYSESIILKKMIQELRKENGVEEKLPYVEKQRDKLPRHVLQKTLEVLTKVNKYREINGYGMISVPPVPSRDITPQDVYNNVERLKMEVSFLLKDKRVLEKRRFKLKRYVQKTPSDVYRELWSISLGFDKLLGQGFTPTDVYILSEQVVKTINFLRETQREHGYVEMPELKTQQHPNHALYKSVALIEKISHIEKKLWMRPVPVPSIPQKVISPTEVYDSLQTVTAELNRISRRLGVERHFALEKLSSQKTPADVVQNLEYASLLLPNFNFNKHLNQYPKNSLVKTPNDVFALSEFILHKIEYIKSQKGIKTKAKETTYLYGLKPIHVYVKGIENLEKIQKLKELEGFFPSATPLSPTTNITPSEVYELILRLDDEINLIYSRHDSHLMLKSYREVLDKKIPLDKTPSDAYNNLWKISYELDAILNQDYTPNETFVLAKKIENDIQILTEYFLGKKIKLKPKELKSKRPSDVFVASVELLDKLQQIKDRGNLKSVKTAIPKDKVITPTSVYNALRIISATISEIRVFYSIETHEVAPIHALNKTPSDVYSVVDLVNRTLDIFLMDSSYEN